MKIVHGTAIYTGGGMYIVIGQLDNGKYFYGNTDFCGAYDADTRTWDEVNKDLACVYNDWCEEHEVNVNKKELYKAFKDFCERLDAGEPGITHGYEKFSNYSKGEVTDMLDFDYFEDLEESKMSDVKSVVNKILEGVNIRTAVGEVGNVGLYEAMSEKFKQEVSKNPVNKKIKQIADKYGYVAKETFLWSYGDIRCSIYPKDPNSFYPAVWIDNSIETNEISFSIQTTSYGSLDIEEYDEFISCCNAANNMMKELKKLDFSKLAKEPNDAE